MVCTYLSCLSLVIMVIIYIDTVIYVVLKQFLKTVPTYIKVTFEGEQNLENFEKLLIWWFGDYCFSLMKQVSQSIFPVKTSKQKISNKNNLNWKIYIFWSLLFFFPDPNQYHQDMERASSGGEDVYETFNIIMRRKPKENNFKAVLETIRDLMNTSCVVPEFLHDIILGYGDPGAAHYRNMAN